ncbi:Cytidylyltransferase-like [Microlunatus sagamiharensis]|uniref:Cytidylyltransferase-like n=1 Tax=Microlunatus sagamiharensis TaxID=546874 RepID=A0A1H2NFR8_9ACTN|nr:hypothetical protein [Microlunatus sagamiharensis]SDV04337.1 Cytidylyltransferase-like [Microlunatus sagamiharensis]
MSVGYLPHSFDLFNVAHLHLVASARERCERLVLGVLDDDEVRARTGRPAVVPLAERLEIASAVRGVDEVVVHAAGQVPDGAVVLVAEDEAEGWPGSTALPAPRRSASAVLGHALRSVQSEAVA